MQGYANRPCPGHPWYLNAENLSDYATGVVDLLDVPRYLTPHHTQLSWTISRNDQTCVGRTRIRSIDLLSSPRIRLGDGEQSESHPQRQRGTLRIFLLLTAVVLLFYRGSETSNSPSWSNVTRFMSRRTILRSHFYPKSLIRFAALASTSRRKVTRCDRQLEPRSVVRSRGCMAFVPCSMRNSTSEASIEGESGQLSTRWRQIALGPFYASWRITAWVV